MSRALAHRPSLSRWFGKHDDFFTVPALFEDFFRDTGLYDQGFPTRSIRGSFVPSLDVVDNDKEILVTAELPGLDEDDIDVTVQNDYLILKGEKKNVIHKEDKGRVYEERSFGSFHRTVALPSEIDRNQIKASFKKGILEISLPKTSEAKSKTKKIKIN